MKNVINNVLKKTCVEKTTKNKKKDNQICISGRFGILFYFREYFIRKTKISKFYSSFLIKYPGKKESMSSYFYESQNNSLIRAKFKTFNKCPTCLFEINRYHIQVVFLYGFFVGDYTDDFSVSNSIHKFRI